MFTTSDDGTEPVFKGSVSFCALTPRVRLRLLHCVEPSLYLVAVILASHQVCQLWTLSSVFVPSH